MPSISSIIYDADSYDIAVSVSKDLGIKENNMVEMIRTAWADGEFKMRFSKAVESGDTILIMRLYPNVNDNIVKLMFALKKLNDMGKRTKVVIPYLAYARQDKEFLQGEVASVYVLGDMLAHYGVEELIVMDVHNQAIGDKLGVKLRNVSAIGSLAGELKASASAENTLVISPDEGSIERSKAFAEAIGAKYTFLEKHRDRITGDITTDNKEIDAGGKEAVIFDDMIATGGTIINAAKIAKANGASKVIAVCTHALLLNSAAEKLKSAGIDDIIATNSIRNGFAKVDISHLIADALRPGS